VSSPRDAPSGVRILASRTLLRGRIFDVVGERVRLPSGLEQEISVVEHPGAVAVAAEFENGDLLLVRQYRHAVREWLLEIPAGRLEPAEEPLQAARRELEEETGYRARRWQPLLEFYTAPGFCSERMTLFLARDLEPASQGRRPQDRDEEIEVVRLAASEALRQGARDSKTWIAAAILSGAPARPRS